MKLTPMLEQYFEIKRQVPDAILFYRLGDFYEMFFEDAEKAAPILDLVLTARNKGQEYEAPMCGVPWHAADQHIARLVAAGRKVAVCDQVEDPKQALFAFLADLENHWLLTDRFVEVLTLERPAGGGPARGGRVRVRGPLGISRTAQTRVAVADPPHAIAGTAAIGRRTEAQVRWTLAPEGESTRVRLEAAVQRAGARDAVRLGSGGRRWLGRRGGAIHAPRAPRVVDAQDS